MDVRLEVVGNFFVAVAAEDLVVPKPGKVITGREGCREEFICTTSSAMAPTWSKVGGNQSIEHLVNVREFTGGLDSCDWLFLHVVKGYEALSRWQNSMEKLTGV